MKNKVCIIFRTKNEENQDIEDDDCKEYKLLSEKDNLQHKKSLKKK